MTRSPEGASLMTHEVQMTINDSEAKWHSLKKNKF